MYIEFLSTFVLIVLINPFKCYTSESNMCETIAVRYLHDIRITTFSKDDMIRNIFFEICC